MHMYCNWVTIYGNINKNKYTTNTQLNLDPNCNRIVCCENAWKYAAAKKRTYFCRLILFVSRLRRAYLSRVCRRTHFANHRLASEHPRARVCAKSSWISALISGRTTHTTSPRTNATSQQQLISSRLSATSSSSSSIYRIAYGLI